MRSLFVGLGILLLSLTFGCSSINQLTQDGIGQPISTIINSWGPPSRVAPDGRGGSVYIWEQWVATGYGSGYLRVSTYWADSNGIIYKWT
jgi:hypothetical protein